MARVLAEKQEVASQLAKLRRELRDATETSRLSEEVRIGVERQRKKLQAFEFFAEHPHFSEKCPVCLSLTAEPTERQKAIKLAFSALTEEGRVVKRNKPVLDAFKVRVAESIDAQSRAMQSLDTRARELIAADNVARTNEENAHKASKVSGRIGFFLEHLTTHESFDDKRLKGYEEALEELEEAYGGDAIEDQLRAAESLVSDYATEIFQSLPVVEPFERTRIVFNSKSLLLLCSTHPLTVATGYRIWDQTKTT